MKTPLHEIFDEHRIGLSPTIGMNALLGKAVQEGLSPASDDSEKILFLAIDMQNDFMEKGELAVPGSHRDNWSASRFLYSHLDKITRIAVSLDTHQPQQIFHPIWWIDGDGNHPAPFTIITPEDVLNGKWRAVYHPEESLAYVRKLGEQSKKELCIWPYHCLEGTYGAALESQFANMVFFHSIARKSTPLRIVKGKDPLSEMYGIIKPELAQDDDIGNIELLRDLKNYDRVIVVGEAKSHCVLESLRQILTYYESDADMTSRIVVLSDCMSPIPGFEQSTEDAFAQLQEKYGMTITTSTALKL
jgi:nicotinamidase-related amidase